MKFRFYTFGVPEGFDLYPADTDKIQYFQRYYDGSSENEKLSIQRTENIISYSYLRYNHIGSRTGSFFGMSLLFEGQYCIDFTKLYQLFGELYSAILKQGILLAQTESGQPKFGVPALKNAANVIDAVKNNIQAIIDSQFANDFKPLDSSFKQGINIDKVMQLNDKAGNAAFLMALQEFPMISISPAFSGGIVTKIPQEKIDTLVEYRKMVEQESNALKAESKIVSNSFSALSLIFNEEEKMRKLQQIAPQYNTVVSTIDKLLGKCAVIQRTVTEYQKIEPKLIALTESLQKVVLLKSELDNEKQALLPFESAIQQVGSSNTYNGGTNVNNDGKGAEKKQLPSQLNLSWFKNFHKNKSILYGVVGAIIIATLLIVIFQPFKDKPTDTKTITTETETPLPATVEDKTAKLIEEGNNALQENEFDKAIGKFTKAGKTDLVENVKQKAIEYWYAQAGNTQDIQKRRNCFVEAKKYGGYPSTDNDITVAEEQIKKKAADDAAEAKRKQEEIKKKAEEKKKTEAVKPTDCTFGSLKKSANQYLEDIENQDMKAGRYESAVACCNLIINATCTTEAQKSKAKALKRLAESNL